MSPPPEPPLSPSSPPPADAADLTAPPSRRRHALKRSHKRAIVVVGVLVVLVIVGAAVLVSVAVMHHNAALAEQKQKRSLSTATNTLVAKFNDFSTKATACEQVANPYQCTEKSELALVPYLTAYGHALSAATGAGVGRNVVTRARKDVQSAATAFHTVGSAAPTKAGYLSALAESGLARIVAQLQGSLNAVARQVN